MTKQTDRLMRSVVIGLIVLSFGSLAVVVGLKLGGVTLMMVLIVTAGLMAQGIALARNREQAKRKKEHDSV